MVVRRHVLPPSNEDATTSSRPLYTGTMSCFQVATMLRGFLGLTAMAGSTTRPSIFSSSWNAPGQPAGNGVGPETVVSSATLAGGRKWGGRPPPPAGAATVNVKIATPRQQQATPEPPPPPRRLRAGH